MRTTDTVQTGSHDRPKLSALIAALTTSLILIACGNSDSTEGPADTATGTLADSANMTEDFASITARNRDPVTNDADIALVIDGFNQFSLDVHKALTSTAPEDNAIISGYSLANALALTMSGTANESRVALSTLLHLDAIAPADLDPAINAVDLQLESRANDKLELRSANRLFVSQGETFKPAFLDNVVANYGAPVTSADFRNQATQVADEINAWVKQQTHGLIEKLVEKVDPDTTAAILNAILLDAIWSNTFEELGDKPFTSLSAGVSDVPFFGTQTTFPASLDEQLTVVDIPYAGNQVSMLLIMPEDLDSFESSLNASMLADITRSLVPRELILGVPAWSFEQTIDARSLLIPIGLPANEMDFSAMLAENNRPLAISEILQKSRIEVDKDGTRAAAATVVVVGPTSAPVEPPAVVTFDKPFWYAIRDRETGLLLFSGRVTELGAS